MTDTIALMAETNIAAIEAAIGIVDLAPNKAEALQRLKDWLKEYKIIINTQG
jgi:hypothetical protein